MGDLGGVDGYARPHDGQVGQRRRSGTGRRRRPRRAWRYVSPRGELDSRAAGRGLRTIHDALADYDGPLPAAGHPEETAEMLASIEDSDDVEFLSELAARRPEGDGRPLHGDGHLENCLATAAGPLWHDFESACRGPREYDLAALVLRDLRLGYAPARQALAAYGAHDPELLRELVPTYAAWVYASMLTALPRRPELAPVLDDRIRWLRGYVAGADSGPARNTV